MELIFSTASTELFKVGESSIERWRELYQDDEIVQGLDHPVVAFNGTDPVGLFEVTIDYYESIMWLDLLWVAPDSRLSGVGSSILHYLTETCQYKKIKLYAANHSAPFYQKHGFKCSVGNYYERDND